MDKSTVERLAAMIKLDLSEAEITEYTGQLGRILDYLKTLEQAPAKVINYAEWPSTLGQPDEVSAFQSESTTGLSKQFVKEQLRYLEVPAVFKANKEFKTKSED